MRCRQASRSAHPDLLSLLLEHIRWTLLGNERWLYQGVQTPLTGHHYEQEVTSGAILRCCAGVRSDPAGGAAVAQLAQDAEGAAGGGQRDRRRPQWLEAARVASGRGRRLGQLGEGLVDLLQVVPGCLPRGVYLRKNTALHQVCTRGQSVSNQPLLSGASGGLEAQLIRTF